MNGALRRLIIRERRDRLQGLVDARKSAAWRRRLRELADSIGSPPRMVRPDSELPSPPEAAG